MVAAVVRGGKYSSNARELLPHAVVAVQDLVFADRLKRHDRVVKVLREARLLALVRPDHGEKIVVPQEAVHGRLAEDHGTTSRRVRVKRR